MNQASANSIFKFTTFADNKLANSGTSIFNLYGISSSVQLDVQNCNILNNAGTNIIFVTGSITILVSKCNFVNNVHPGSNSFESTTTLSECYIDNYKGGAKLITKSLSKPTDLKLSHFSTYKCEAVNPLYFNNPTKIIHYYIQYYTFGFQVIVIF